MQWTDHVTQSRDRVLWDVENIPIASVHRSMDTKSRNRNRESVMENAMVRNPTLARGFNSPNLDNSKPTDDRNREPLDLRAFIDRVPALAWSTLANDALDFFNQRFRDYTGLSSDLLYGSDWKSPVHQDDIQQFETWWQSLRQSQEAGATEVRLHRCDGECRWFQIAATPVHDEQGRRDETGRV